MHTATYETESAVFHFDLPDVLATLNAYPSEYRVNEACKIQKSARSPSLESLIIPDPQFGYVVLDFLRKGKGTVFCKVCQKTYQPGELKSTHIGFGRGPFEVNLKEKGGEKSLRKPLGRKIRHISMRGGEMFVCPEGHGLISLITWIS